MWWVRERECRQIVFRIGSWVSCCEINLWSVNVRVSQEAAHALSVSLGPFLFWLHHFRVDDQTSVGCVTYDSKVASFFSHNNVDDNHHPSRQLQYVGVLKDILQLDYGTMSTPIVLFRCDWVRNASDNCGNPTYKQDDAGFLMANFRHMLLEDIKSFVFPSQVQQVFYAND